MRCSFLMKSMHRGNLIENNAFSLNFEMQPMKAEVLVSTGCFFLLLRTYQLLPRGLLGAFLIIAWTPLP